MAIAPLMPVYPRCEVEPVRGEGAWLYDDKGDKWLDFASGIAVNILGHGHPHLVQAIQQQAATLMHVSNLYGSPQQRKAAERLIGISFADTVFFTNSGVEAVECAVKTARAYQYAGGHPERRRLISFAHSFHGRTLGMISATDQEKLRQGFEPLPDWFRILPYNDLDAVRAALDPTIAGFLLEPVQGEGGINQATPEFLRGLRALADEHDLMLVLDEVQTGVFRTGTLFAYQQYGIEPDVMAIAKGIGGGFPVGACLASEKAARGMTFGRHGSTFGGNPLAMAAVNAILDVITEPAFQKQVQHGAARLRQALEQMIPNHDLFRGVRGVGMLLGIELNGNARAFVAHARAKHGLLTVPAAGDIVRIVPPLNISDEEIRLGVDKLGQAAASFAGES